MANDGPVRDYVIRIRHERPESGKGVEFVSIYYAKESKDEKKIEEIFKKAFTSAHPTWVITKVVIEVKQ